MCAKMMHRCLVCSGRASKTCSRCKQGMYCSAEHQVRLSNLPLAPTRHQQKVHWKFHKYQCVDACGLAPASVESAIARVLAKYGNQKQAVHPGVHCFLCLEETPPLVSTGCACRGSSGYVHEACFDSMHSSMDATATLRSVCSTCNSKYQGVIFARQCVGVWKRFRTSNVDGLRCEALRVLAIALDHGGEYGAAAELCDGLIGDATRQLGPTHVETAMAAQLGGRLHQRRHDFDASYRAYLRAIEAFRHHGNFRLLAGVLIEYASLLVLLDRDEEGLAASREAVQIAVDGDGVDSERAILCRLNLALLMAKSCCDDRRALLEAEAICLADRERARRLVGATHRFVAQADDLLADIRSILSES